MVVETEMVEKHDRIFYSILKLFKYALYAVLIYLLITLIMPSMSFPNTISAISGFVFIDIPSGIFNFFHVYGDEIYQLYDRDTQLNQWALVTGKVIQIIGLILSLGYYLMLFLIFALLCDDKPKDPFVENETMWLLGMINNEEIIKAKVQANAIADALKNKS